MYASELETLGMKMRLMDVKIRESGITVETMREELEFALSVWAPELLPMCETVGELMRLCWPIQYLKVIEPLEGIDFGRKVSASVVETKFLRPVELGMEVVVRPKIDGIRVRYTLLGGRAYIVLAKSNQFKAIANRPDLDAHFENPEVRYIECELINANVPGHAEATTIWAVDTFPSSRSLYPLFDNRGHIVYGECYMSELYLTMDMAHPEGYIKYLIVEGKIIEMRKYKNYTYSVVRVKGSSTTKTNATQLLCDLDGREQYVHYIGSSGLKFANWARIRSRINATGKHEEVYALEAFE
jgi:hypothetical protein